MTEGPTDFWMVWNPAGRNPTCKHFSRAAAQAEAERLAETNPGHGFYVLHALSLSTRPPTVKTVELSDGIPF